MGGDVVFANMHESIRSHPRRMLLRAWKARLPLWLLRLFGVVARLESAPTAVAGSLSRLSVLLRGLKARLPLWLLRLSRVYRCCCAVGKRAY